MIPSSSDPRWRQLIEGKIVHSFKAVSASMLLHRLGKELKAAPSEQKLGACVTEARAFFEKFESVFQDDLKVIFK